MADRKVAKVPVILQMEALECGAASLAMVMAFYHKWVPLDQVRVECGVSRDGSNALNILKAAKRYGLECHAKRYTVERLQEKASYPAIIFWSMNHFVVLDGFKKDYVYIVTPSGIRSFFDPALWLGSLGVGLAAAEYLRFHEKKENR